MLSHGPNGICLYKRSLREQNTHNVSPCVKKKCNVSSFEKIMENSVSHKGNIKIKMPTMLFIVFYKDCSTLIMATIKLP